MFLLGHLGIGERMGRPFTARAARASLFLGTVLPDLIDKPLYYAIVAITHHHGARAGLISGTRTIGHTLLCAMICGLLWRLLRGRARGWALFVGMCTHLLLDLGGEVWFQLSLSLHPALPQPAGPSFLAAIFFPLLGPHFPFSPFHSIFEHVMTLKNDYIVAGELVGGLLLFLDWRQWRRERDARPAPVGGDGDAAPASASAPGK